MKKLIIILCIFMCSCASQRGIQSEETPYFVEHKYNEDTGTWYIIEHYYDPNLND